MGAIRSASVLISVALHGGLFWSFANHGGGHALEAGTGTDMLRIEQGMAIEGLTRLGEAPETIEARDVETLQSSVATPALEEVKALEAPPIEPPKEIAAIEPPPDEPPPPDAITTEKASDLEDVVASPLGENREVLTARPPPPDEVKPEPIKEIDETPPPDLRPPQPKQVATEEQIEQVAVIEQEAAAQAKEGGDSTLYTAYLGSIRTHIERYKVKPRSLERGTAVVRFTVNRQGEIVSREIATSSGSRQLDEAALSAIEKASPFPKFPQEMSRQEIVLSIPFRFITR